MYKPHSSTLHIPIIHQATLSFNVDIKDIVMIPPVFSEYLLLFCSSYAVVNHHPGTKVSDTRKSINTRICELRQAVKWKNKDC